MVRGIADPAPKLGPLFELEERDEPNVSKSRLFFEGPAEPGSAKGERELRLSGQLLDVFDLMRDGVWRTLAEISAATNHPEASVSAQLRHLRKPRWGSHTVEKSHRGRGLYAYRLHVRRKR